ncbi:Asp/Glu/hydantoin racemase [Agromyces intestinalis]|uniref:Asp/Glu/hydantoin racemase n=1 Tax=Agromyces intestinalis TaxID=2592652 RepID=A0A5C1YGX5_9MICO|nr:aspartate/glutamate racemase family protein [Agromyces intestinalis]QEO15424.1 Asp/Glu/hydantoin racemase [Agromyces intestinalis]
MTKIAVLHTSFVFVKTDPLFDELMQELVPDAEVVHFVDSDVLATVIRDDGISDESTERMVHLAEAAEAAGADLIFSACSSLGPALDVAAQRVSVPVVKVDDAMAHEAAARASRIGVLATVPTTLGPTSDLIAKHAAELGREVTTTPRLAEGAFDILVAGDRARHDELVVTAARALADEVELLVLAQASMSRLAERIEQETGMPVLVSPRLGVGQLAERAHELGS